MKQSRPRPTTKQLVARFQEARAAREFDRARAILDELRRLVPWDDKVPVLVALVDADEGHVDAALPILEAAIARIPGSHQVLHAMDLCYERQGRFAEGQACQRRIAALAPVLLSPLLRIAFHACHRGHWLEAAALMRQVAVMPTITPAEMFNRGIARLVLGDLGGFADYEARFDAKRVDHIKGTLLNGIAHQDPHAWEPRQPGTVLVVPEQGLGDAIQMLRYLPLLQAAAEHLIVSLPRTLLGLAQRAYPSIDIRPMDDFQADYHWVLRPLSCPALFGVPVPVDHYLTPPAIAPGFVRPYAKRRIAISWKGSPRHGADYHRSMPLEALTPLFHLPGIEWVSVQQQVTDDERALLWQHGVASLDGQLEDASQTAAFLASCGLVVTVDTMLLHLAGALGRQTIGLLSTLPEWRWPLGEGANVWYPSVMILRQPKAFDWADPVRRLATLLARETAA